MSVTTLSDVVQKRKEERVAAGIERRKRRKHTDADVTIFIGNVPKDAERRELARFLREKDIEVETVRYRSLVFEQPEGRKLPRKALAAMGAPLVESQHAVTAYAKLGSVEDVEKAIAIDGEQFKGRRLRIDYADKRKSQARRDPSRTLFIGNLPPQVDAEELTQLISHRTQATVSLRVVRERTNGLCRGVAFAMFPDALSCNAALPRLKKAEYGGRKLRISKCDAEPRQRTASVASGQYLNRSTKRGGASGNRKTGRRDRPGHEPSRKRARRS